MGVRLWSIAIGLLLSSTGCVSVPQFCYENNMDFMGVRGPTYRVLGKNYAHPWDVQCWRRRGGW